MSVEFLIQRPKQSAGGVYLPSKFTAFGTARLEDGPLSGVLVGDKGTAVAGITLGEPPLRLRWSMFFSLEVAPREGEKFTLCIFGGSARVPKLLGSVESITIGSTRTSGASERAVPIGYPDAGTNHCNETFFAEGGFTKDDTAIVFARVTSMQDPTKFTDHNNPFISEDHWSASFPVIEDLPAGHKYRLDVRGNAGSEASVGNLDIRSSHCGG